MRSRMFSTWAGLFAIAAIALATPLVRADDKKTDDKKGAGNATGTWKWTMSAGGQERELTLKLKQDGDKLTGAISQNNRETEIKDGKVKDGEISFKVTRTAQGREVTTTYTGKVEGDTIKGTVQMPGRDGGEGRTRDWEAKRAKDDEKKEDKKDA